MVSYLKTALFALVFILLTIVIIAGCSEETTEPNPQDNQQELIFVANHYGSVGALSMMDLISGAIRVEAAMLGNTPSDIISWENRLYVINNQSHNLNVLAVADNNTVSHLDTIDLGASAQRFPVYGDIDENGKLYVSNKADNTVSVYDIENEQIVAFLPVGQSPGDVMVVGSRVYVCNTGEQLDGSYTTGSISIISTVTNLVERNLTVGTNPIAMDLDPKGRLHVLCAGNVDVHGQIVVVETVADTIAQYIDIGGTPEDLAITNQGIGYVAAGGWTQDPGLLFSYNASTGQILSGPNNPIEVSRGASRVTIGPDNRIFVSCMAAGRVDEVIGNTRVNSHDLGDNPKPIIYFRR